MSGRIAAYLALLIGAAAPLGAESPQPFATFEAKRVKPPSASERAAGARVKLPQIAIAPAAPAKAPAPRQPDAPPAAAPGTFGWFWEKVAADMDGMGPGRLEDALSAIAGQGPQAGAPRLKDLHAIARSRGRDILAATVGTEVSPALVLAVIATESSGRADAVSGAGAQGLMQLMPATAARFGVSDSFAPGENIRGGVRYLDWLMREFNGDPLLVLAAYNAGEGAVKKHQGVPPYAETRDYVPKVLTAFQVASGLCLTPPLLMSDGCVFAAMN